MANNEKSKRVIMHFRDTSFLGSPEKLILDQIENMSDEFMFMACVFKENQNNEFLRETSLKGVPTVVLGNTPVTLLYQILKLYRILKKRKVNILCTHDYKSNFVGLIAGKMARANIVSTFHGRTSNDFKIILYEQLDNIILPHFDRIICVSDYIKNQLSASSILEDKLIVIRNAIDTTKFVHTSIRDCNSLREEFDLPRNAKIIITIGRLSREKGQKYLIMAFSELMKGGVNNLFLMIVGDGPEKKNLNDLIQRLNLAGKIFLLGMRKDVPRLLKQTDIFVLPSLKEGLPMVLLEALALGKPVIATKVGGIPELINDGVNGMLIAPGTEKSIYDGLCYLLQDEGKVREFQNSALISVKEKYDIKSYIGKLRKFYETILS
jgi:glycosyltransferase involved in cell wall biosynthesis